ncbi:hypothetical protein AeRB84_010948 [Aphanomyces euteiches]|nr:hypothetical protein AeRB84_010948 [Aphanomyces euteiches]
MPYIASGGQVVEKRSWFRVSIVSDLFWGFIGVVQLFFSTFFGGEGPKRTNQPRRGGGSSGGGGGGPSGGSNGGGGGGGGLRRPIGRIQPPTCVPGKRAHVCEDPDTF